MARSSRPFSAWLAGFAISLGTLTNGWDASNSHHLQRGYPAGKAYARKDATCCKPYNEATVDFTSIDCAELLDKNNNPSRRWGRPPGGKVYTLTPVAKPFGWLLGPA